MTDEERMCQWPAGCDRPARPRTAKVGPHPIYCFKLGHTTLNANRLRRSQDSPPPTDMAPGTGRRSPGIREFASGGASIHTDSPRMVALLKGEINVEDLDDEELARGYPRDRNGNFGGRPPRMIPLVLHRQIQKVFFARLEEQMRKALPDAIAMLATIATNPLSEDRDKLKAIDMVMNRIMGKPPEKIEISGGDKPFEMTVGKMRRGKAAEPPEPKEAE